MSPPPTGWCRPSATARIWFSSPIPVTACSSCCRSQAITRPEQLRGKRIGTGEAGSSQDRITRETLRRLGLEADKDVTLVPYGSRSVLRVNALLKGEIDATTSNEDNIFDLERRGEIDKVRVLADNDSLKLYIGAGVDFAATRKLLAGSRDAVKRFTQALSEATAVGAARPWGCKWYLHPLFESERPGVAGIHVPDLCAARDTGKALSENR